jgi:hypothetical protein
MRPLSKEDYESGLDEYDPEYRVFPKIAERITAGGELTKQDMLRILKWKLGRVKDSNSETVSDEHLKQINNAVNSACKLDCGADSLEALDRIPGIGLATATAILTICYPEKYTILDLRVLEILEEGTRPSADDWTASTYMKEFLPKVRQQQALWACSLRNADRALWGLSASSRIAQVIDASIGPLKIN